MEIARRRAKRMPKLRARMELRERVLGETKSSWIVITGVGVPVVEAEVG